MVSYTQTSMLSRLITMLVVLCHSAISLGVPRATLIPRDPTCLLKATKDWDAILAQEEEGEEDSNAAVMFPRDMQYNNRNCQRSARTFQSIHAAGGEGADVYGRAVTTTSTSGRDDSTDVFWYLGKVAWISGCTATSSVQRQWNLIQHHAANLRPIELFASASRREMEVWCAPLDSEMDVAYQRPHLTMKRIPAPAKDDAGSTAIPNTYVGFQGEMYEGGEEGFRSERRLNDGGPGRPEIQGPPPQNEVVTEAPSDEQMERLHQALEGKDINEVYEAQERRRKRMLEP